MLGSFGGRKDAMCGVGGVDDRRGGKGLAKWMGGGVHGIVMVERESCVVCGKNWLALSR